MAGHKAVSWCQEGATLHMAAEPAARSAVKILVSQRNDTVKPFQNKNSAQVPLASTSS